VIKNAVDGLVIVESGITMDSVIINFNASNGVNIDNSLPLDVIINQCLISNNSVGVITVPNSPRGPQIINSIISNNTSYGIYNKSMTGPAPDYTFISGCIFDGNATFLITRLCSLFRL